MINTSFHLLKKGGESAVVQLAQLFPHFLWRCARPKAEFAAGKITRAPPFLHCRVRNWRAWNCDTPGEGLSAPAASARWWRCPSAARPAAFSCMLGCATRRACLHWLIAASTEQPFFPGAARAPILHLLAAVIRTTTPNSSTPTTSTPPHTLLSAPQQPAPQPAPAAAPTISQLNQTCSANWWVFAFFTSVFILRIWVGAVIEWWMVPYWHYLMFLFILNWKQYLSSVLVQ